MRRRQFSPNRPSSARAPPFSPGVDGSLGTNQPSETRQDARSPPERDGSGGPCRSWRRRTLPPSCLSSTIRAVGLNGRVRDGNGCDPHAIIANSWMGRGSWRRASSGRDASRPSPRARCDVPFGTPQSALVAFLALHPGYAAPTLWVVWTALCGLINLQGERETGLRRCVRGWVPRVRGDPAWV